MWRWWSERYYILLYEKDCLLYTTIKIQLIYISIDEETCVIAPDIQIKLSGSSKPGQGYIELKAYNYSFGGICDDGFGIEEAHVICRMAGFPLGAKMAHIGSVMGHGSGDILLDELNCKGDEATILECKYNPWTQHDCRIREWAGVTCQDQEICSEEVSYTRYFQK